MRKFIESHRKLVFFLGGVITLGIAILYTFIISEDVSGKNGIIKFILQYAHGLTWLLLSVGSFLYAYGQDNKISKPLAYSAAVSYAVFMAALLLA